MNVYFSCCRDNMDNTHRLDLIPSLANYQDSKVSRNVGYLVTVTVVLLSLNKCYWEILMTNATPTLLDICRDQTWIHPSLIGLSSVSQATGLSSLHSPLGIGPNPGLSFRDLMHSQ